jgi:hypothetical protein
VYESKPTLITANKNLSKAIKCEGLKTWEILKLKSP